MSQCHTARGPIDTADLGVTLMHEHVFIMTTEIAQNYPEAWGDEDARVADDARRKLAWLQWATPALTGAVLVLDAGLGEQQRGAAGLLDRPW